MEFLVSSMHPTAYKSAGKDTEDGPSYSETVHHKTKGMQSVKTVQQSEQITNFSNLKKLVRRLKVRKDEISSASSHLLHDGTEIIFNYTKKAGAVVGKRFKRCSGSNHLLFESCPYDSPSYTLSHFIKPHMMPAYLAIRAFNIELARIPDVVSNPSIGSMRMQAWRQFIDATFKMRPPEEPVAILLASYLHQGYKLNKTWFKRIIDTRDQKLTHPGFASLTELESYAEATYSTLLYLSLSALPVHSVTLDHLASHIGKAAGITAVLRGVPLLAFPSPPNHHSNNPPGVGLPSRGKRGIVTLPLDVMSQSGLREERVLREGGKADGLQDAVFAVATRASDHLITAQTMLKNVRQNKDPGHEYEHLDEDGHQYFQGEEDDVEASDEYKRSYGILMGPAISTQLWLDRLQKVDFDIFNESLRRSEWKLPFIAWWKSRQMRI